MIGRFFSLLEVMIALVLLAVMGSAVGFHIQRRVAHKRFHEEMERFKDRITTAKMLSITMQADWKGTLKKNSSGWVFEVCCEDIEGKKLKPLYLKRGDFFFNGKKSNAFTIEFYSSGQVLPTGTLQFQYGSEKKVFSTTKI